MKTKKLLTTFMLTIILSMFSLQAFAYDIEVANADGVVIYYNYINDASELEVTCKTSDYYNQYAYAGAVVIPEEVTYMNRTRKVTSIGERAFFNCNSITSVTIPDSVTSIGEMAFYYCSGLTSITIPDSVTNIGRYAFLGCSGLTSFTIPNSVTIIDDGAFKDCSGLISVMIPNSVTRIGDNSFWGCI